MVDLDLPFDLREPMPLKESNVFTPLDNNVINMKYKPADELPYGCLKNGFKKTYRNYKPATSVEPTLRELKLKQLQQIIEETLKK